MPRNNYILLLNKYLPFGNYGKLLYNISMFRAITVTLLNSIGDEYSFLELTQLLKSLDFEVIASFYQTGVKNSKYGVGSGRLLEIREMVLDEKPDLVVFDVPLTGKQIANIEKVLEVDVVDRGFIILQIFCQNAKTKEAQLEVELAQKKYMLPRLGGSQIYSGLSRQGGGYSAKGPGETKLETDRRKILSDISSIKKALVSIDTRKNINSKRRLNSNIPIVSLIGYTNAGKSSLFNNLSSRLGGKTQVLEKDAMFSTLGTKYSLLKINGKSFILVDSVGFISHIPTELINSFYSTLKSLNEASLIIHLEDGALEEEELVNRFNTATKILENLKIDNTPIINVYSHKDKSGKQSSDDYLSISNSNGEGIDELIELLYLKLTSKENLYEILIKLDDYKHYSYLKSNVNIISESKNDTHYIFKVSLDDIEYSILKSKLN
jgi:GTP-binding protein HflX